MTSLKPSDLFDDLPDRRDWEQPRFVADNGATSLVLHVVECARGAEGVRERPMSPLTPIVVPTPTDWRDGIVAATHLEIALHNKALKYVELARGEGMSWVELAPALGVTDRAVVDDDPQSLAEAAWAAFQARQGNHMPGSWMVFLWTCSTCLQNVYDHGPFHGLPEECERGHADDCARHRAAIAAWNAAHPGHQDDDR